MIIQNPVIHNYEVEEKKDTLKSQFENCGLHLYSTIRYFVEPPFTAIMSSGCFGGVFENLSTIVLCINIFEHLELYEIIFLSEEWKLWHSDGQEGSPVAVCVKAILNKPLTEDTVVA